MKQIRNVAICGHNGTGKTTLLEQILFFADKTGRAETVDSGKTVSDYTEEEIARKMSIHSALASFSYKDKSLNFIDTPGTSDFIGEVTCGFRSCEAALIVVDAKSGAQIETIKLWRDLNRRNKPRAVFMNSLDKDNCSFDTTFENLKEEFDKTFIPITIPIGTGEDFKGIVNLIEDQAWFFTPGGKEKSGEIPGDLKDKAASYRHQLIEAAAEGADDLMEKYFEENTLEPDEIRRGICEGMKANRVVPILCGSAGKGSGIASLVNFIANNFPHPAGLCETVIKEDGSEEKVPFSMDSAPSALCFKTTIDQFSGKLSYIKVVTGAITSETELTNPELGKKEKAGKLYTAIGKKLVEIDSLNAGEIGIITKSSIAGTNCTLVGDPSWKYTFKKLSFPSPVYSLAISAADKKSEDKMNDALSRVTEEDLTFKRTYNEETKQSTVAGMGELHINIILDKIREKQKISILTRLPRIAYRETITKKSGLVEFTHKKQSGGHGQFGKVVIEIAPTERGEYYKFENVVKGGNVSKGYVPGIEKGIHDQMDEGFLAGYPMVDVAVTLVDGKEHPVDSSEMSFRLAAKGAMKAAIEKAGPVLLEPFGRLSVYIDNQYLGDILSDLSSKRGRVLGQEDLGGNMVQVNAEVPQGEMLSYAIDLKSMTSGTGSFELDFDHYETLSGQMADKVIKEAKAAAAENS